jgi:phosphoribosylformylglycinamidine (FGAM) synthase-like enzyme
MRGVAAAIRDGKVRACHDLSEGGLLVAAAEMAIGGGFGMRIAVRVDVFDESPSRFLLEVEDEIGIGTVVGEVLEEPVLDYGRFKVPLAEAREAFFHWEKLLS